MGAGFFHHKPTHPGDDSDFDKTPATCSGITMFPLLPTIGVEASFVDVRPEEIQRVDP
jgi:hypothetical protein